MELKVSRGMIAVGITNIVLASLGLATVMILVAAVGTIGLVSIVTGHPLQIPKHFSLDFGGLGLTELNVSWVLAGALCVVALSAALDVLLFAAGLCLLRNSSRGRTYSLIWAVLALCMGALDAGLLLEQWSGRALLMLPFACLSPAYALLLVVLFRRPAWRHAFAS